MHTHLNGSLNLIQATKFFAMANSKDEELEGHKLSLKYIRKKDREAAAMEKLKSTLYGPLTKEDSLAFEHLKALGFQGGDQNSKFDAEKFIRACIECNYSCDALNKVAEHSKTFSLGIAKEEPF
mmetsp:Transcript_36249/g.55687  ORF Transcript_36249/g.55687 Transcript_36249/m.55687 type:complete len:124 (+) Transcript_36249:757-1128(+)